MPAAQGARIVEAARKNSVIRPAAVAPPVLSGSQARTSYGGNLTEEPQPHGRTSSMTPAPPPSAYGSPRNRPADLPPSQSASPRPFANAPRYALADPGSGSATGPRPAPQAAFGPPRQSRQNSGPGAASAPGPGPSQSPAVGSPLPTPAVGPPRKGPQTFAEMGINTAKVEEKECIIM